MRAYAGLGQRAVAFAYDYLLIAAYLACLGVAGGLLVAYAPAASAWLGHPVRGQLLVFLILTVPAGLYFAVGESSHRQATWGKARARLRVGGLDGARLGFGRALLRSLLKFIPWEMAHTSAWHLWTNPQSPPAWTTWLLVLVWGLVGANLISLWLSPARQTLYDRLAGAVVTARDVPLTARLDR